MSLFQHPIEEAAGAEEIDPNLVLPYAGTGRLEGAGDFGRNTGDRAESIHEGMDAKSQIEIVARSIITPLAALLGEIQAQREFSMTWPLYAVVGEIRRDRFNPQFPGEGQWILDSITYWADPAAVAPVQVALTIAPWSVPIALLASKTDVKNVPMGIPFGDNPDFSWTATGTNNDRATILPIFKRKG